MSLLDILRIPYITSPTEAEATAAVLNSRGLVDAVLTDDIDAFLFGATTLIRSKSTDTSTAASKDLVDVYEMSELQRTCKIDRNGLVFIALVAGSDYSLGLSQVGVDSAVKLAPVYGPKLVQLRWNGSINEFRNELHEELRTNKSNLLQRKKSSLEALPTSWPQAHSLDFFYNDSNHSPPQSELNRLQSQGDQFSSAIKQINYFHLWVWCRAEFGWSDAKCKLKLEKTLMDGLREWLVMDEVDQRTRNHADAGNEFSELSPPRGIKRFFTPTKAGNSSRMAALEDSKLVKEIVSSRMSNGSRRYKIKWDKSLDFLAFESTIREEDAMQNCVSRESTGVGDQHGLFGLSSRSYWTSDTDSEDIFSPLSTPTPSMPHKSTPNSLFDSQRTKLTSTHLNFTTDEKVLKTICPSMLLEFEMKRKTRTRSSKKRKVNEVVLDEKLTLKGKQSLLTPSKPSTSRFNPGSSSYWLLTEKFTPKKNIKEI